MTLQLSPVELKLTSIIRTEKAKTLFRAMDTDRMLDEIVNLQAERRLVNPTDYATDAEIHDWHRSYISNSADYVIWGICYADRRGRFRDGQIFRTSLIAKEVDGYAVSLNSIYRLIGGQIQEGSKNGR